MLAQVNNTEVTRFLILPRDEHLAHLRQWVSDNNKILFDVADIEAHAPSGTLQTFIYGGNTYEKLCGDYASDEGHLNDTGSELVARGFYALGDAIVAVPEPSRSWIVAGLASVVVILRRHRFIGRS